MKYKEFQYRPMSLTLLHSERPKLYTILAFLSAKVLSPATGLKVKLQLESYLLLTTGKSENMQKSFAMTNFNSHGLSLLQTAGVRVSYYILIQ